MKSLPEAIVYTDGSCSGNPGPGGWAAVFLLPGQEELSGGSEQTTNNRMELQAALEALRSLKKAHQVDIFTDSEYLVKGMTEWLPKWEANHWRTKSRTEVKNQDLWKALVGQAGWHRVTWHWVKAHNGDTWNERADQLAKAAAPKRK